MALARYRRVLALRAARNVLILGILVRVPLFAGGVVLTLHVVAKLGRDYGQAGLVSAAATVCLAISAPWRGRLLDRFGLRRVILPSLVVMAVCWSIAPFVGYWLLFGLAALAGLFAVPTFSIIRQAMITVVPEQDRRTALALDSVAVELSFMIGPVIGVWAATTWDTSWVLFSVGMAEVLTSAIMWLANPAIASESAPTADGESARIARREWFRPRFVAICVAAAAATVVLSGTDISIVAALRDFGSSRLIGPVLAVWGLGSLIGGLVYGALHRAIPAFLLLGGLSLVTIPIAFAPSVWPLTVLAFIAGVLCAPTITATVDQLSRAVPDNARGEAMGWHGSSMTTGSALGAPLAGVAIDWWGVGAGFVIVSVVGLVVAVLGWLMTSAARQRGEVATSSRLVTSNVP
jgi:MFS family permease